LSQTYDRKLQDIFAIQDEIAKAIGKELEVKLVRPGEAGKTSAGTSNLAAYDLYLRGIALWQMRRGDALWQAIDLFEKAAAADPEFAQAYGGQHWSTRFWPTTARVFRTEKRLLVERILPSGRWRWILRCPSPTPLWDIASDENRRATAGALLRRAIALRPSFATAINGSEAYS